MNLKGKTINFLGDSITEGYCVSDLKNRYDNILKEKYNLKAVNNYGIGGTRLAHQTSPSDNPKHDLCFCGRAYYLDKNADIIVVYGGVNDYLHGDAYIGNKEDDTPKTFYGAVNYLMKFLKETYINQTIVFMTPAHCYYYAQSDTLPSKHPYKKSDALPLKEYVEIIIQAGKEHNVPVLNMFESIKICPENEEIQKKYIPDGLHFNDEGQYLIADALGDFLEKL